MKASEIMHPEDAKAIQVLRKMKGFDQLIRFMMEVWLMTLFKGKRKKTVCLLNLN